MSAYFKSFNEMDDYIINSPYSNNKLVIPYNSNNKLKVSERIIVEVAKSKLKDYDKEIAKVILGSFDWFDFIKENCVDLNPTSVTETEWRKLIISVSPSQNFREIVLQYEEKPWNIELDVTCNLNDMEKYQKIIYNYMSISKDKAVS